MLPTVWQKISDAINARARRWADWLNQKAEKISPRNMGYILLMFCLFWGAASVYIIIRAWQKKVITIPVTAISLPKHVVWMPVQQQDTATERAVQRIETFKRRLDSLSRDPKGKAVYENIVQSRPGLMDSIHFIEQFYQQPYSSKKK